MSSASFAIAKTIGGDVFSSVFLAGLVVTQFASGLAAQTAVARLLYAMGRDSVLPKRIFAYIHPKFHTPAINVLLAGLVGLIVLELNVAASTSFINFGAFSAFTFVNLCVIAMFIRQRREDGPSQRVVPHVVFPASAPWSTSTSCCTSTARPSCSGSAGLPWACSTSPT